jgi:hypothetical protein
LEWFLNFPDPAPVIKGLQEFLYKRDITTGIPRDPDHGYGSEKKMVLPVSKSL